MPWWGVLLIAWGAACGGAVLGWSYGYRTGREVTEEIERFSDG
jgi:hypothetical protein